MSARLPSDRILVEHDRVQVRAMAHLVITLCTAADPVTRNVLRAHAPDFGDLRDALAGAEEVRAALLVEDIEHEAGAAASDCVPA